MNIISLYASKHAYAPQIEHWPDLKAAYPFGEFLYNYGWSKRPYLVMASRVDRWTDLKELGNRIAHDFGIEPKELANLQVATEHNGTLSAFNTYDQFLKGANKLRCDSLVVAGPGGDCWYVLIYNKTVLKDYVPTIRH